MPLFGPGSEVLVAQDHLKTNKAPAEGCATFRSQVVQGDFFSPSLRLRKGLIPVRFSRRREKTLPDLPESRGTSTLFYNELQSPGSNSTTPLSEVSRTGPPLSQPSDHLDHQGLAGQFPMPRLGGSVQRSRRPERTERWGGRIP